MENEKDTSKKLLFLEPVNNESGEEELLRRLIARLEALGFNITNRQEGQSDEI